MSKNQEENQIKPAQPEEGAHQEAPQETPQEEKNGHKGLIKNERVSFITGVILIIFSIYMTISFISFLFTGSVDQSKIENLSIGELSSISNDIQNWTGAFGAYLSNLMINRWMGISAFIVALWLYVVGRRFIKVSHTRMIRFTITCALSIIVLSLFFGFIFLHSYEGTFLYLGGYHGYYATQWLNAWIGPWGTALFIAALAIILLVHLSYKTIDYIRRASSVNLTGRAIQSIRKKADQWANSDSHSKDEEENNEAEDTAAAPEDTLPEEENEEPAPGNDTPTDEHPADELAPEADDISAGFPDDLVEPLPSPDEMEEPAPLDHEETKRLTIDTGESAFFRFRCIRMRDKPLVPGAEKLLLVVAYSALIRQLRVRSLRKHDHHLEAFLIIGMARGIVQSRGVDLDDCSLRDTEGFDNRRGDMVVYDLTFLGY